MSKINLKDNIWIEGFESDPYIQEEKLRFGCHKVLYSGKTSEIPEEIAKECVSFDNDKYYRDYSVRDYQLITAKESIQSACYKLYCIIYKTKQ